jgi:hypothetical protein
MSVPLSKEMQDEMAEAKEQLKKDALAADHTIRTTDVWRTNPALWANATPDQRRDLLCGLIFYDGFSVAKKGLSMIAALFKIKVAELNDYIEDMKVADAARCAKIFRNQFQFFLMTDHQPMGKFFIGKQFAYQVNDPAHEGVDSVADRPQRIIFEEEKADPEAPKRKAMESELNKRIASVTSLAVVPKKPA